MEAVWNNSKANWPGMTSSPVYMWRTKPEGEYKKQRKSSVLKKSYGLNVFKQTISSKSQWTQLILFHRSRLVVSLSLQTSSLLPPEHIPLAQETWPDHSKNLSPDQGWGAGKQLAQSLLGFGLGSWFWRGLGLSFPFSISWRIAIALLIPWLIGQSKDRLDCTGQVSVSYTHLTLPTKLEV